MLTCSLLCARESHVLLKGKWFQVAVINGTEFTTEMAWVCCGRPDRINIPRDHHHFGAEGMNITHFCLCKLTLILPRSRTGTVWFYTSTSNKRAARPKLYTKSLTRDLKLMHSRFTLVRISINLNSSQLNMFREIILPIFRSTRLCVTSCGVMHTPRCCRPKAGNIVLQSRVNLTLGAKGGGGRRQKYFEISLTNGWKLRTALAQNKCFTQESKRKIDSLNINLLKEVKRRYSRGNGGVEEQWFVMLLRQCVFL